MQLVTLDRITKHYPIGKGYFTALHDVSLQFEQGEFCGIIGPSGSGKTTLLNIIGSLDSPSAGSAIVLDKQVEHLKEKQAAHLRSRNMGFIFQTYNLLPVYSVFENVEFPLLLLDLTPEQRKQKVIDALTWVGLMDKINSRPAQLSGGECQRVAIARAIVKRPKIVLADEPTANLDADNSKIILDEMRRLNEELKITFIFATHDEKVIHHLKRKIFLIDGRVVKDERI
ncbi:ABC transporter ATP-binding protein [bacterium]